MKNKPNPQFMALKRKIKMALGGHITPGSFLCDYLRNNGFKITVFKHTNKKQTSCLIEIDDPVEDELFLKEAFFNKKSPAKIYKERKKNPIHRIKKWFSVKRKLYNKEN
jgi:hypothetical protein